MITYVLLMNENKYIFVKKKKILFKFSCYREKLKVLTTLT